MAAPIPVPIPEADRQALWNELQNYIAELAPFDRSLAPQGPYAYPDFDRLWSDPGRSLFWSMLDGEIAGLAIVQIENGVADMEDFSIRPAYRRRGAGLWICACRHRAISRAMDAYAIQSQGGLHCFLAHCDRRTSVHRRRIHQRQWQSAGEAVVRGLALHERANQSVSADERPESFHHRRRQIPSPVQR